MSLTIADAELSFDASNTPRPRPFATVLALPLSVPLLVQNGGGPGTFTLDLSGGRQARASQVDGSWQLVLPWPSESRPSTVRWRVERADGTVYAGAIPEGQAGPVTVADLLAHHGWGLVSSPDAPGPVAAVQGPPGPAGAQGVAGTGVVWRGAWSSSSRRGQTRVQGDEDKGEHAG